MKKFLFGLIALVGIASAQPANWMPGLLPPCTLTYQKNCTPQVTGSGAYRPIIPLGSTLSYFQTDAASSPTASYKQALITTPAVKVQLDFATQPVGTDALQVWATNAGVPGITQIPAGNYTWHIHAAKTAGNANRTFTLYAEFWEVDASEVDVGKIGTTESSIVVAGSETEYTLVFHNNNPYNLAGSTSRIAIKTFAVVAGTGNPLPTVSLFYGGTADSGLFIPSTGGIASTDLPAAVLVRTCEIVIGDPGAASSALADDNDSPAVCANLTGATMTILEVKCRADSSTGSPTVLPIITGGATDSILASSTPLACGNAVFGSAGTLNGTPTQVDGATIDGNISTAGGTAKYIIIRIKRTL